MQRYLTLWVVLFVACLAGFGAVQADEVQNAGPTWNNYNEQYNFDSYPTPGEMTFDETYNGSNFESDFQAILDAVAADLMAVHLPPAEGDDILNATLENWPVPVET
ncbi:hypothetical protein IIA79_07625 [bacterium]|nr:hypothetical protein [bacterium]